MGDWKGLVFAGLRTPHSIKNVPFYPLSHIYCSLWSSHVHIHYSYVKRGCMPPRCRAFSSSPIQSGELILFANKCNACNSSLIDYSSFADLRPLLFFQLLPSEIQPSPPNYSWKLPRRVWHFALFHAQSYREVNIPVNEGHCIPAFRFHPNRAAEKICTYLHKTCLSTGKEKIIIFFLCLPLVVSRHADSSGLICPRFYDICPPNTIEVDRILFVVLTDLEKGRSKRAYVIFVNRNNTFFLLKLHYF